MSDSEEPRSLELLLQQYRGRVTRWVQRHASPALLRMEGVEDLVQSAYAQALTSAPGFEDRSEAEFQAWLFKITRRCLRNRSRHWGALKRNSGKLLRLTWSGSLDTTAALPIPETGPGPVTLTLRKEQLLMVAKALDRLSPRDQNLILWSVAGQSTSELSAGLEISANAAERARQRAFERLREEVRKLLPANPPQGSSRR